MEGSADSDVPVTVRPEAGRAAALARLLHRDCTRLLELYRARESFLSHHVPGGDRLVSVCAEAAVSTLEQINHVHSALRRCVELLECLISREEEEEMGEDVEGEFHSLRKAVKDRLGHLIHTTGALLDDQDDVCPPSTEIKCSEDEVEGSGSFGDKLWTYRVLLELIHWTDSASQTLHLFHTEQQQQQQQQIL